MRMTKPDYEYKEDVVFAASRRLGSIRVMGAHGCGKCEKHFELKLESRVVYVYFSVLEITVQPSD